MVVTVSMNPAIDKTVEIPCLQPGGLNRITRVEYDAGGKGINVSKTIRELGGESIAAGFLGGNAGKMIENVLNEKQIRHDFIWVEGETRTNTKVFEINGAVTELNEPGPVIIPEQIEGLLEKLSGYADKNTLFILAGSIPNSVDKDIYARIIRLVHKKGAKVLMDADGELFRCALAAGPDMIKPNRVELEEYAGFDYRTSDVKRAGGQRNRNGSCIYGKKRSDICTPWLCGEMPCPFGKSTFYSWSRRRNGRCTGLCMGFKTGKRRNRTPLYGSICRGCNNSRHKASCKGDCGYVKGTGYHRKNGR